MNKTRLSFISLLLAVSSASLSFSSCGQQKGEYDILIVGGGTSGTAAAIQAARDGAKVLLVEEHEWLGGMLTSAGVSATDGCYALRGGIWDEFRDSLETWYGGTDSLITGWVSDVMFEPSVGARIFGNIAAREKNLTVEFNTAASGFEKTGTGWKADITGPDGSREVSAKILVDGTELGDVAKAIGIPYEIGMDSASDTREDIAPEKENDIVQDLTYVMILQDYGHPVPIPEPDDYTIGEFACCCTNALCKHPKEEYRMWSKDDMITYGKLQNGKYMINWPLEGNDYYCNIVDATPEERAVQLELAKQKSLRFLYFLQNELGFVNLGIAEEYPTSDGFPFIPYHRESRRIDGQVKFTLNDIVSPYTQTKKLYRTGIGVGDYPVDQHHTQYHGWEDLPNLYYHQIPSYSLPIGVMMPKKYDDVLVIEKSISVTNIVNGTTRLQPVVLQLGQAAGAVAAYAVKHDCGVSEVSVREIQKTLLDAGAWLVPLLDLPSSSPWFKTLQRIALTGILKYEGKNFEWENQSWIYPGEKMLSSDLISGMSDFYTGLKRADSTIITFSKSETKYADIRTLAACISSVTGEDPAASMAAVQDCLAKAFGKTYGSSDTLTRLECAVAIDSLLDPFGKYDIDIYGNLKDTPVKFMWVDLSANWKRFQTEDSVRFYCEKIARTGMTTIILDVKGSSGEVPYKSDYAPEIKEWKGVPAPDFDYIRTFSDAAKANGLKIYCAINTFAEGNGLLGRGTLYKEHPEWQAVNYVPGKGLVKQTDIENKLVLFSNPALPEVRKNVCNILVELVSRFDIDGVILDRGRYDNIQSDFSDFSKKQFEEYIGEKVGRFPEDIYEWVKNPETGQYEIHRGKYFLKWIEWRASVIYSFFEEARNAVKTANPDADFGAYTGAWYPTYYEVGVNWASHSYDPSAEFDWATPEYRNYAYAELLDIYTTGNYYPLVSLDEYYRSNGIHKNETDSTAHKGEYLCVEGACEYTRKIMGDNPFLGGINVPDYAGNPEQFQKAVRMNLEKSDGLMIFDMVHLVDYGWWDELADAIKFEN